MLWMLCFLNLALVQRALFSHFYSIAPLPSSSVGEASRGWCYRAGGLLAVSLCAALAVPAPQHFQSHRKGHFLNRVLDDVNTAAK